MADLEVRVTPRSAADRVGPYRDGVLAVRVTRAPVDGEANRALQRLVARALGVPPTSIRLAAGERGRRKRLVIDGLSPADLAARLSALTD